MLSTILVFLIILIFGNTIWRRSIAEAIRYKRNKKQIKELYKSLSIINHILRIYPIKLCYAPNHLKKYYVIRCFNIILFVVMSVLLLTFSNIDKALSIIFLSFTLIPILIDYLYLLFKSPSGWKTINFDIYKNP